MKMIFLILTLIILNPVILNLNGYCADEGDAGIAVTETTAAEADQTTTAVETAAETIPTAETAKTASPITPILDAGYKALYEDNDLPVAMQKFEQVIAMDPENIGAYFGLGFAYLTQGDAVKGREYFTRVIMIDFENSAAYRGLANC